MIRAWLATRSRREQILLRLALFLLMLFLLWTLLLKNAIHTLRNAPQDIERLKQTIGILEQQAEAIAALSQQPVPSPISLPQAQSAIRQLFSNPENLVHIEQLDRQSLSIKAEHVSPELTQQFLQLVHEQLHARINSAKWQWINGYWQIETLLELNDETH